MTGKKEIIYEFISFLEERGYTIATLVPEKGLFTVTQTEKYNLVDEFLERPE